MYWKLQLKMYKTIYRFICYQKRRNKICNSIKKFKKNLSLHTKSKLNRYIYDLSYQNNSEYDVVAVRYLTKKYNFLKIYESDYDVNYLIFVSTK